MIPFIALFTALMLEISLGGFLSMTRNGTIHLYAATFIFAAFSVKKNAVTRLSFLTGLMADVFLNSLNFFGFFLILYIVLGYFISWLRMIFLKKDNGIAILLRPVLAITLYWIFYTGFVGIKAYFWNNPQAHGPLLNINFFAVAIAGILMLAIIVIAIRINIATRGQNAFY